MIFGFFSRTDMTRRDRRNQRHMAVWWVLWIASLAICGELITSYLGDYPLAGLLVLVPVLPAILFLRAGSRLRRENDELVRRVHTEAASSGFVFGMLCGMSFFFLAPGFDLAPKLYGAAFMVPMIWAYAVRVWIAAQQFGDESIRRHGE